MIPSQNFSVELSRTDWIILEDIVKQQSNIYFDKIGIAAESYRYKLNKILKEIKNQIEDHNPRTF